MGAVEKVLLNEIIKMQDFFSYSKERDETARFIAILLSP